MNKRRLSFFAILFTAITLSVQSSAAATFANGIEAQPNMTQAPPINDDGPGGSK